MVLTARHGNTKKYRLIVVLVVANLVAIGIVVTRLVPQEIAARVEQAKVPLEQVETLQRQIDSIDAQQQGTYDFIIQQSEETEMQFERLSIEVEKTRGLVLEVTK